MKILRAKQDMGQQVYSLDEIYPMSDRTTNLDMIKLKQSLDKGMENPIIVTPVLVEHWMLEASHNVLYIPPPAHLQNNETVLQIKCGCNRYRYAVENGYTHIEAILLTEGEDVAKNMQAFEKWWKSQ